jgi:hypothetical protein
MVDGQRTQIWSGEFDYWRLPSPDLWRDVLQKMKAEGYNAVLVYFDWAYTRDRHHRGAATSRLRFSWSGPCGCRQ